MWHFVGGSTCSLAVAPRVPTGAAIRTLSRIYRNVAVHFIVHIIDAATACWHKYEDPLRTHRSSVVAVSVGG